MGFSYEGTVYLLFLEERIWGPIQNHILPIFKNLPRTLNEEDGFILDPGSQSSFKGQRFPALSQIRRDIMMSCSRDSITTVSLLNGSEKSAPLVKPDLMHRLDGLFAFYHRQWWCQRQMFYHFKWCYGCLNALALIIAAGGIVVGSVLENSTLVACLTADSTVIKGWNDFKNFSFKIDMCRFAYKTKHQSN